MKKIVFMFDYGAYPIWIYDGPDMEDNYLPEELSDDQYIIGKIDEINDKYESLFINNKIEFSYKGFSNEEEKKLFLEEVNEAVAYLKEKVGDKYHIETRIDDEF